MSNLSKPRPVCLLGLGLIGGSLLRDLVQVGRPAFGFDPSSACARDAQAEGFDVSADLTATLQRAQGEEALIVIAAPMPGVEKLLDAIAELAPGCGITDVVSVKKPVLDLVNERGMGARYVGGHPMSGVSASGWAASRSGLFDGAAWVISYDRACLPGGPEESWIALWSEVAELIALVGADPVPARADIHDATVARISHLPHVFAETLAIVGDQGGALALSLAAGSFRDGTRVAGSSTDLVRNMCETNSEAVSNALDDAIDLLMRTREQLRGTPATIGELADAGHRSRERFLARSSKPGEATSPRPVFRIHPGETGWVEQLRQAEDLGARLQVF